MPPSVPPLRDTSRPRRDQFALTGRAVVLDPRTHAVRPDLADVRLARQVFAPHYAFPVSRTLAVAAELRAARDRGSEVLAMLDAGAAFDLLDVTGDDAWGLAPAVQLVGYLNRMSLAEPAT